MARKYRKKPLEVEAIQYIGGRNGTGGNEDELKDFAGMHIDFCCYGHGDPVLINTDEGRVAGRPGDWIIRGVEGEFYPCKPSVFEKTYEAVE